MRHLENFTGHENTQMGITIEEIKECFYDLSDEGWDVSIRFKKKLMNAKSKEGVMSMDLIPTIEIKINRNYLLKVSWAHEVIDLKNSEVYKGCIDLLNGRLNEYGLSIFFDQVKHLRDGTQIFILIYRKSDISKLKQQNDKEV